MLSGPATGIGEGSVRRETLLAYVEHPTMAQPASLGAFHYEPCSSNPRVGASSVVLVDINGEISTMRIERNTAIAIRSPRSRVKEALDLGAAALEAASAKLG